MNEETLKLAIDTVKPIWPALVRQAKVDAITTIICIALLGGLVALCVWWVMRYHRKDNTSESEDLTAAIIGFCGAIFLLSNVIVICASLSWIVAAWANPDAAAFHLFLSDLHSK